MLMASVPNNRRVMSLSSCFLPLAKCSLLTSILWRGPNEKSVANFN